MIQVNFEGLDTGSANMSASYSRIDDILNNLESKLNGIRERWDGHAQAAYSEAQAQWDKLAQELNDLLRIASQRVAASGQNYLQTDQSAANRFR
jgi:WXG100 family type VII secretion target